MDRQLTFILLDKFVIPDMRAVAEAIRARHPGLPVEVPEGTGAARSEERPLIKCAGELVVVMSMPAPFQPRPNDPAWRQASVAWPQLAAAVAQHQGHIIVSTLGTDSSPLTRARIMTAVIGALIEATPGCIAVTWGGQVIRPADHWRQMAASAFDPYPDFPHLLWIGIQPFDSGSAICAVTSGLSFFVGREIEFEGDGLDMPALLNKVAGLAIYLIEHGLVIQDGQTCGATAEERFRVRHVTSRRFAGLPVLLATPQAAA